MLHISSQHLKPRLARELERGFPMAVSCIRTLHVGSQKPEHATWVEIGVLEGMLSPILPSAAQAGLPYWV